MRHLPPEIEQAEFDLIIIGGGINGAGVARDAALRGLKVLLLEQDDLASGTSSWSTRLIHGGLRYLEHGELHLVRESLKERERLLSLAPHLVRPLPLLIPIYGQRGGRGRLMIRAGMLAYDLLSYGKSLASHRMLSRAESLRRVPGLEAEQLQGAALYYDAQVTFAERLVLENALAAQASGALILNHARVTRLVHEDGAVRGVEFTDLTDETRHVARARLILNVSGPWVDQVLELSGAPRPKLIGGTKGTHIVVSPFQCASEFALYVEAAEDRRPFFIIPWNGQYLIGTTDERFEGDPGAALASEREIEYLLRETNRVIPRARLTRSSINYAYAGVRPLAYAEGGQTGGITRRHFIHEHEKELRGLISLVGGKLTTYRNLAEETVDLVMKKLGRAAAPCRTATLKLPGAATEDYEKFRVDFMAQSQLPDARAERLLNLYGVRAIEVLECAAPDPELREPLIPGSHALGAEVLMAFKREMAVSLTDCLMRRLMLGLEPLMGLGADARVAVLAQKYLGWSSARAAAELLAYRQHLKRFQAANF